MDDEHHKPVTLPTVAGPFRVRFVPGGPLPPRRVPFDDEPPEPAPTTAPGPGLHPIPTWLRRIIVAGLMGLGAGAAFFGGAVFVGVVAARSPLGACLALVFPALGCVFAHIAIECAAHEARLAGVAESAGRVLELSGENASAAERLMLVLGEPVPTTLHTDGRPRYVIGTAASLPAVVDRVVREVLDLRARVRETEATT